MEAEEKEKTGIRTLKIGYNKVFGYYIEEMCIRDSSLRGRVGGTAEPAAEGGLR